MPGRQALGYHSSEGQRKDVDHVEAESCDEGVHIVGHFLYAAGHLSAGSAHTAGIESDDEVALGDGVNNPRVPVVQVCGEEDKEDDRDATFGTQLAVGIANAVSGYGAPWGLLI